MVAIGSMVAVQAPAAAWAGEIPFTITSPAVSGGVFCTGPRFRQSGCVSLADDSTDKQQFYAADVNFLSPYGYWTCDISLQLECTGKRIGKVGFCLKESSPAQVDLVFDGASLSVNADRDCSSALVIGALGQNGEPDGTPAQDIDTFRFAGKAGEKVTVTLDRDGGAGSDGQIAKLRVSLPAGNVLGERTGSIPLVLDVILPGPVEIAVQRQGGVGDPFRGSYALEVVAQSGDIGDRQLRPTANVEH